MSFVKAVYINFVVKDKTFDCEFYKYDVTVMILFRTEDISTETFNCININISIINYR